MTVLEVRNEYITQCQQHLPDVFSSIQNCAGTWSEDEIRAYAQNLPALYIALLGVNDIYTVSGSSIEGNVQLACYIFCQENEHERAENVAAELVQHFIVISEKIRHADFMNSPTITDAQNLYSKTLNDIDIALWGLRITQRAWLSQTQIAVIEKIENTAGIQGA